MRRLGLLILLAACAPRSEPDDSASVTVASGGMLGRVSTTVYVDDRVLTKIFDQGKDRQETTRVVTGAYARAMAVIAAEGPGTLERVEHEPEVCLDYGIDLVRVEPPTAAFDMVAADCPDDAVTALMDQVLAALDP